MIYIGSRYETAEVQFILDGRSLETRPTVLPYPQSIPVASEVYRFRAGDRMDIIGKTFAGRASEWWRLMDLNPETIDPLSVLPGEAIVVR